MLACAAGWSAHAAALETQAAALAQSLHSLGQGWTGAASDTALGATLPMIAFLQNSAVQAQARASKATAQAEAFAQTLLTAPTLPEIETNHVTTATLTATNFFGINTMPIAASEADYFERMWNQAAVAMDVYEAESTANSVFDQLEPLKAIFNTLVSHIEDFAHEALGMLSELAARLPEYLSEAAAAILRQVPGALIGLAPTLLSAIPGLIIGLAVPAAAGLASSSGAALADNAGPAGGPEIGLAGANPFSNHPAAGGSGPALGAGLMRADSLPGAAGTPPRTALLAEMLSKPAGPGIAASAGSPATGAAAPAGAGAGPASAGGAAPVGGAMGRPAGGQTDAIKVGLVAPPPLVRDDEPPELDRNDDW